MGRKNTKEMGKAEKYKQYLLLYDKWMECKQNGYDISDFFKINNLKSVAIYGYWILGPRLQAELEQRQISVEYIIDRDADNLWSEKKIYKPDMQLPVVDVVVVTPFMDFEIICEKLKERICCPIISIEDIII